MKEKKSLPWTFVKYAVVAIFAVAALIRMSEENMFDQPWLWPFLGLGWIIYTLARDIDKLNKRIASLEHAQWQHDNNPNTLID